MISCRVAEDGQDGSTGGGTRFRADWLAVFLSAESQI
jgi:hypothetical protein